MNTAMSDDELRKTFDQIVRNVTRQAAGICLHQGSTLPTGEVYTVYVTFERGFCTSLSLCAEAPLFARLTRYMMRRDEITRQDVEDFTKEYFNMLCGQLASRMFKATRVASRFGIPAFCHGQYAPEGSKEHFVIRYTSDGNENMLLTHHTPCI